MQLADAVRTHSKAALPFTLLLWRLLDQTPAFKENLGP